MVDHNRVLFRQPGQTSTAEVKKRDLRAELLAAEQEARDRKRKAEGKPPLAVESGVAGDDEANKRRKLLQEALEMDKDDDEDDDKMSEGGSKADKADNDSDECVGSATIGPGCHSQFVVRMMTTMRTTTKMTRLNFCANWRRLSGNEPRRRSDKSGNKMRRLPRHARLRLPQQTLC